MNCFSENITLNAGQHEKAKTKSFSDIYTTKTTLKKFNFYVRENRQKKRLSPKQYWAEVTHVHSMQRKMHRGEEEEFIKIHGLLTVW